MEPHASAPALSAPRLERVFVALVALHSVAVGAFLAFLPEWSGRFGGFGTPVPTFFARQGGVFHMVIGVAYLAEHLRSGGVSLLVFAKSCAAVFLVAATLAGGAAWAVPVSAAGDAFMAVAAAWLHRRAGAARPS